MDIAHSPTEGPQAGPPRNYEAVKAVTLRNSYEAACEVYKDLALAL